MKIVFLDQQTLGASTDMEALKKLGEVVCYPTTSKEELHSRIQDADILLTNKVIIDKTAMDLAPKLRYIGITATGTNNVDLAYAASKKITVTNVKGYSTESVVGHTFALALGIMEQLSYYDTYVKSGAYTQSGVFTSLERPFCELNGKTWGIIGLGEIGRGVARVASSFGCRVIYFSTTGLNQNPDYEQVDWETLLTQSDILSVHAPLTPGTEGIMGEQAFSLMRKTAYFINVGRGPIVNEKALAKALDEGWIAGAALDVFANEPMESEHPFLTLQNPDRLLMTPHIAWASVEARGRLIQELYLNIEAYLAGRPRNVVG